MWADRRAGLLDAEDWQTFKAEHAEEKSATEAKIARLEQRANEDAAAPVVVPAVADALSLVREFVAQGDTKAVRNVVESLFSDFVVGHDREIQAADPASLTTPEAARAARTALQESIAEMERESGRSVAESNAEAEADEAAVMHALPYPPPADDPLVHGLSTEGLLILPEPRREALEVVMSGSGPTYLVDQHGRDLFRRLPLQTTNGGGLREVIVRAALEPPHPVELARPPRQHHQGRVPGSSREAIPSAARTRATSSSPEPSGRPTSTTARSGWLYSSSRTASWTVSASRTS